MGAEAIIGAGVSLAGNATNWLLNDAIAEQNWYNQLQMWNMTNEYNSPSAQMARFRAAGLNPNLIYSQSNTSQSPAPALIHPDRQNPYESIGQLIGQSNILGQISNESRKWADFVQKRKESESRIAKNNAVTALTGINKDLAFLKFDAFHRGDYFGQMVNNLAKRNLLLKLGADIKSNELQFLMRTLDSRIAAVELKNDLMSAQTSQSRSAATLNYAKAKTEPFRRFLMQSQAAYNTAQLPWLNARNQYATDYWKGESSASLEKFPLMVSQRGLYQSRQDYTDTKNDLLPWQFGLDAVSKLGRLGLDIWKTAKNPYGQVQFKRKKK